MERKIINENWYFVKDYCEIIRPSECESVNLPHTWNNVDGQDGGGDYFRGKCTYFKTLNIAKLAKDEDIYLEFCGVSASATVYLNGKLCGTHDGGYSTFRLNITDFVIGGSNEICVIADNGKNDRVYPQNADFTFYGGIYRDVSVITVSKNRFDLDYFGGNGVKITPTVNADGSADVTVESYVTGKGEVSVTVDGQTKSGVTVAFHIDKPRLWNGKKDPHLYTAEIELKADGKTVDSRTVKFGIRSFEIDPDECFILNGKSYPLRGVAMHQDWQGIGNAITKEHIKKSLGLIYEGGFTTVRLAHYQHDQYVYDLCDELGLVVWAEIPYISEHLDNATDNAISQMTELVVQNYNHPSIVVWGLSNEITMAHGDNPNLPKLHNRLNDLCHKLDKTRKTTMACITMLDVNSPLLNIPDVLSYNHYFGWYGGRLEENGEWLDRFHKLHPDISLGLSEYGCENSLWHSSRPEPGDYTEEYQCIYHESLIKQLFGRKYLWATHVWNMFDFAADARDEGGTHGRNNKGLVTFDRQTKKDAFYAYKAWLTDEPMLHLCGKRFINRDGEKTRITAYSNLSEVTLYINGNKSQSLKSDDKFFHFEIEQPQGEYEVTVRAGELEESATFNHVDTPDPSYSFGGGQILNWFDLEIRDGYFSVKDLIKDMMTNPEAMAVASGLMTELRANMAKMRQKKEEQSGKKVATNGEAMTAQQRVEMTQRFSILQLIKMGMPDMPKERIIEINNKLNKIKKQ